MFNGAQEQQPTIHDHNETTYYIGKGWMDDFSDRLYIKTKTKQNDKVIWQRREGTVTFTQSLGWKSWGGRFELIDRGTDPTTWGDSYGRWVIRTTDPHTPPKVWAFQEYAYTAYGNTAPTYALGRLTRHALLGANPADLDGVYGYTVSWHSDGYISSAADSLGRQFTFSYLTDPSSGTPVKIRALASVSYLSNASASPLTVSFIRTPDWMSIDRINVSSLGNAAPQYVRFLYNRNIKYPTCAECPVLLTDVIVPRVASSSTTVGAFPLSSELVLEHNDYTAPSPTAALSVPGVRAMYSSYPGREYAYQYNAPVGLTMMGAQFDLKQYTGQPAGACVFPTAPGVCPPGSHCRSEDGKCYVTNTFIHDSSTRLPVSKTFGGSSTSTTYNTGGAYQGAPRSSVDPGGTTTTFGFDSEGRLRCRVSGDTDDEAFADPASPDSSDCSGPANAQIVKVDYNGPCTDGYTLCTLKTTTSLLSGTVVEEEDLAPGTRLPVRTKVTGKTRDVNGSLITETHISTRTYDSLGRLIEINGPLNDGLALDKTTQTYWSSSDNNYGQLRSVTKYVGTSTSSTQLVTEYSSYDAWGIPRVIKLPNGDWIEYVTSDRLNWTIKQWSVGNVLLRTTYVTLNPNGSLLKTVDADNVCTTYEHTTSGAVSRIRRSPNDSTCGYLPINVNSGEVEMRSYIADDPDRLESIQRRTDGAVELSYAGFSYDRDRRLATADTLHSTNPFTFNYTDVLQTGVTAPDGPGDGTWRTEQTVDSFARPSALLRFIDATNKLTHNFSYASPFSPRPTQLSRGYNGAPTSVSTFEYDDFGRLLSATVPEAGAPGSPTTTRYEYDVGGRLTKKRSGIGTTLVRTDVHTYDSLGRVLSVDNDIEHPVNCATAPAGTPIQDVEYTYDSCTAGDLPSGFACNNALGQVTVARSVLQCGTGGLVVKRGRWYDYLAGGRVARVAYATVTGTTIGTPAIVNYSYSAGGRLNQYSSPTNSIYGTKYVRTLGKVAAVQTTESTPATIANGISYYAFGPLAAMTGNVTQVSGASTRTLKYESTYYSEGQLNTTDWRLVHSGGPTVANIALLYQNLAYTPAGLIRQRYDFGDYEASRYYGYDPLLRLTCEARGQTSTATHPNATHCSSSSSLAAAVFAYGNGGSPSQPADARVSAFIRAEGGTYVSPSNETLTYASGSSQVQQVNRATSSLAMGHDAVGRRAFEYDSFDASRSRRDYSYLPNGQLGTISGKDSAGTAVVHTMRYDEAGRPLTIAEHVGGASRDSYELFWDDADRLIAVNIAFPGRVCGSGTLWGTPWTSTCTGVRWHYHYLDRQLIAATRELIYSGGLGPQDRLIRYWVVTDERGLVHRLINREGATHWQARWDASGWRTWVGTPQAEIWMPFGLPGQIQLDKTRIYNGVVNGVPSTTEAWGTRAFASWGTGAWTRPPIALNRWRAYDPLMGSFLQSDGADLIGRRNPEGYAFARNSPVSAEDPTGGETRWKNEYLDNYDLDSDCDVYRLGLETAIAHAYMKIEKCVDGKCASNENYKRDWLHAIQVGANISCKKGPSNLDHLGSGGPSLWGFGSDWNTTIFTQVIKSNIECLSAALAHESLHQSLHSMPFKRFLVIQQLRRNRSMLDELEEWWVDDSIHKCFDCQDTSSIEGAPPLANHADPSLRRYFAD